MFIERIYVYLPSPNKNKLMYCRKDAVKDMYGTERDLKAFSAYALILLAARFVLFIVAYRRL